MKSIKPLVNTQTGNEHITAEQLHESLSGEIAQFESSLGESVVLRWLGKQKQGTDTTTKVLVETKRGKREAVIIIARPAAPDLIARSNEMAEEIRRLVGERLGRVIPTPLANGYVDGRSYTILPCYREFSRWKPRRVLQRVRIRNPLLTWLREACRESAETILASDEAPSPSFVELLQYLHGLHFVEAPVREVIERQLQRIEAETWKPRFTIDHNDMWLGNIMLPRPDAVEQNRVFPFMLIDWGGANPFGYGMYDLVRIARALKLSDTRFLQEVRAHAEALHCEVADTQGHLLASLARLHQHLEHFPEERYIATFRSCWRRLQQIVALHDSARS